MNSIERNRPTKCDAMPLRHQTQPLQTSEPAIDLAATMTSQQLETSHVFSETTKNKLAAYLTGAHQSKELLRFKPPTGKTGMHEQSTVHGVLANQA